jgi:hypothetical protein
MRKARSNEKKRFASGFWPGVVVNVKNYSTAGKVAYNKLFHSRCAIVYLFNRLSYHKLE